MDTDLNMMIQSFANVNVYVQRVEIFSVNQ